MSIDMALIRRSSLFQLLDDDEVLELFAHMDEAAFVSGETIFKVGDPGGALHVVLSGKVETFIIDGEGRRLVLDAVEPGHIFGELALFDGEPRSATAVAVAPTRTFIIDREDLGRLFSKKPHAALDILTVLSRRLRRTDVLLSERIARNPNVVIEEATTWGDRISDTVARFGGSWRFINSFSVVMLLWIAVNTWAVAHPFDPWPYMGLNLVLSMLAALQAPVIMMSQNRQDAKDRVRSELDYQVNVRAEVGITELHAKVDRMKDDLLALLRGQHAD